MSRRDLVHVLTALSDLAGAAAGVGVAVAAIDEAVGRGRGDLRTTLNLASLAADGLAEQLPDGTWALTPDGVARHQADEDYADR
jgi:hypothetical protein